MALVRRAAALVPADESRGDDVPVRREQWVADLASPNASERRQAARALSAMPNAVAVVCAHLADEPNLSVRSIILTGLIVNKSPAVVDGLLPLLRSEDANLRNGAIEALQQMPDEVAPRVEAMLADATATFAYLPSTCWPPCRTPWCRRGCAMS